MTPAAIVSRLWNYCNVLRDDGMSYGDYVEQLTCLLLLKMAYERRRRWDQVFNVRLCTLPADLTLIT